MKRDGLARRNAIIAMCPANTLIIDVGADHGHLAAAIGGIATERKPHRRGRPDVPWVIADGLRPFKSVEFAVIAGIGARKIVAILEGGPPPKRAILHAPDSPEFLRRYLMSTGWSIIDEALAPEAGRFAEIIKITSGEAKYSEFELVFGPCISQRRSPMRDAHFSERLRHWEDIAQKTAGRDSPKHAKASRLCEELRKHLRGHINT